MDAEKSIHEVPEFGGGGTGLGICVQRVHENYGLKRGIASPCVYWHQEKGVRAVMHGGDFTILGWENDLYWFRERIQEIFEVKVNGIIGPCKNDQKSMIIYNRIVEWTKQGTQYETDQRNAEIIVRDLGLRGNSKTVSTASSRGSRNTA